MHHKKSEAQIGKESRGISSDFNPSTTLQILIDAQNDAFPLKPTPFKRPHLQHHHHHHHHHQFPASSSSSSPNSNPLPRYPQNHPPTPYNLFHNTSHRLLTHFHHQFRHLRRRARLILLLTLPFFYFLLSHPSTSFLLDFLSAFAFSAALLFSLNLAIPRLPTIRLFLARSLPITSTSKDHHVPPSHLPVFWSIGSIASRVKPDKKAISGCYVQAYSNGDVYEGEFHKGRCSGSGVYYYYMSGRYEGDWVDEKYDGCGVETWARGSRYRGQYKQGLRHGFGVYRFYTGDVYAGEWSNGQSHGCGIHTCEDGSRYVGEFKWGVKHGLGHYHFR